MPSLRAAILALACVACAGGATTLPSVPAPPSTARPAATPALTEAPPATEPPATTTTAAPAPGPVLPDGHWTLLAHGAGRLTVAGIGGDELPAILTHSPSGWEVRPLPSFAEGAIPFDLVADGDDLLLVLVGNRSELWRLAPDASSWLLEGPIGEEGLAVSRAVTRVDGAWLAAGEQEGAPAIWRSDDLLAWQRLPGPAADVGAGGVTGVARVAGATVVIGFDSGGAFAATTADGESWRRVPLLDDPASQATALLEQGGALHAVGTDRGARGGLAWTSRDGRDWALATVPDAFALFDLAATPDGLLAIGLDRDFTTALWQSRNGADWTRLP